MVTPITHTKNIGEHTEADLKKRIEKLEEISKPLDELVVPENFIVQEVLSQSYSNSFTPHSEARYGGESPRYEAGYSSKIRLKVNSINPQCPVHLLNFYGSSIVKSGDNITAMIPRCREETLSNLFPNLNNMKWYIDRDFGLEESAIEIIIKSDNGQELRRDRSVYYNKFFKE